MIRGFKPVFNPIFKRVLRQSFKQGFVRLTQEFCLCLLVNFRVFQVYRLERNDYVLNFLFQGRIFLFQNIIFIFVGQKLIIRGSVYFNSET